MSMMFVSPRGQLDSFVCWVLSGVRFPSLPPSLLGDATLSLLYKKQYLAQLCLPVDHSIVTFSFDLSKVREKVALGENFFYDNDSESMND